MTTSIIGCCVDLRQCRICEKYSSILLTAHRIISLPRRNRVAFGLNRTLSRIYEYTA